MKQTIIIGVALFLIAGGVFAKIELIRDYKIAEVADKIDVYKIVDTSASTTCYVTTQGKWGSHAISCVK